jgi:hypothetical protein
MGPDEADPDRDHPCQLGDILDANPQPGKTGAFVLRGEADPGRLVGHSLPHGGPQPKSHTDPQGEAGHIRCVRNCVHSSRTPQRPPVVSRQCSSTVIRRSYKAPIAMRGSGRSVAHYQGSHCPGAHPPTGAPARPDPGAAHHFGESCRFRPPPP